MAKSKKGHKPIGLIFVFIIIIAAAFLGFYGKNYYSQALGSMDKNNMSNVEIEIAPGSNLNKIGDYLHEKGLIKNTKIFLFRAKTLGLDSKIKAGNYNLSQSMDLDTIIESLTKGSKNTNTTRFTIPEGYEIPQIGEKLANEGLVNGERFLDLVSDKGNFEEKYSFLKALDDKQSLEGFLFPSTYEIYVGATEEDIIEKMLSQFEKIYKKDIENRLAQMDMTINEAITLASIVEREGKLKNELPLMSAVFHNRIDQGMMLQSCATVQYILGERKEVLSTKDTQIPSPYNTYINTGLPPAPIASPGEDAIIAALNPADVDYLFFVLTGADGSHTFTKTYDAHINAKNGN